MLGVNFEERWSSRKHFVVHVPKTGGTSLFHWYCQVHGADQCREHIESLILPQPSPETVERLRSFHVLSGHVPIDYLSYFNSADFAAVTIIRHPIDQFFSHVNHILTSDFESALLRGIRQKAAISTGYFLDHASAEEREFFDNSQSKPVFGGIFNWRAMPLSVRLDWLRQTYTAVFTTETIERELRQALGPAAALLPKLNTKQYRRDSLTASQQATLDGLLREDMRLHAALMDMAAA